VKTWPIFSEAAKSKRPFYFYVSRQAMSQFGSGWIVAKQEVTRSVKSLLHEVPEKRGNFALLALTQRTLIVSVLYLFAVAPL
jgi:hypothetical protein